jgi:hypothetical protein
MVGAGPGGAGARCPGTGTVGWMEIRGPPVRGGAPGGLGGRVWGLPGWMVRGQGGAAGRAGGEAVVWAAGRGGGDDERSPISESPAKPWVRARAMTVRWCFLGML